jgi:argininosuccinate lyase
VFELTRAKCNKIQSIPQQILLITNNLPSGYFRDLQIIKEIFIPAFAEIRDCIEMTSMMMAKVEVNMHILDDSKYDYLFSVEEVNRLTLAGIPFRDAYKQVGTDIESGKFHANKSINHTHQGSIGNLCNEQIKEYMDGIVSQFDFQKVTIAQSKLVD